MKPLYTHFLEHQYNPYPELCFLCSKRFVMHEQTAYAISSVSKTELIAMGATKTLYVVNDHLNHQPGNPLIVVWVNNAGSVIHSTSKSLRVIGLKIDMSHLELGKSLNVWNPIDKVFQPANIKNGNALLMVANHVAEPGDKPMLP